MSTELQKQVAAFKKKTVQVQSLQRGLPSIFLSPKEAAAVDTSAVYEAGCKGLRDLAQYDERFGAFLSSLFHSTSVNLQRELKTKEENAAIDVEVNSLLSLLSLWANEPSAHLVLEYLVRRYRVHEFNMDAVLRAFLLAHDSKVFAKIVHLCNLEDTPWVFLVGVKESGVPPPRSLFVNQALKSPWILDTICDITSRILSLLGLKKAAPKSAVATIEMDNGFRALAFTTAVIVEVANKTAFREDMLRNVCLFLIEGLKSKIRSQHSTIQRKLLVDWKVASCVVLSQLSVRTQFGESLIKAFSKAISVAITMAQEDEDLDQLMDTLMTTATILAQGRQFLVDENVLRSFFPSAGASSWLYAFVENSDSNNIGLLQLVGAALCSHSAADFSDISVAKDSESHDSAFDSSSHIIQFLKRNWIHAEEIHQYFSALLHLIAEKKVALSRRDQFDVVIRALSDYQPQTFNAVIKSIFESQPSCKKTVTKHLSTVFANFGKTVDVQSGDSIFLNLSSAIKEIRLHALGLLDAEEGALNSSNSEITSNQLGIAESLVRCLEDSDHDIASQSWNVKIISIIEKSLGCNQVFQSAQIAWQMWSQEASLGSKSALSVLNSIIQCVCDNVLSSLWNEPSIIASFESWSFLIGSASTALFAQSDSKTAGKLVSSAKVLLSRVISKFYGATKQKSVKNNSVNFADEVASFVGDDNQHQLLRIFEISVGMVDSDFTLRGFSLFLVEVATALHKSKSLASLHSLLSKCLSLLVSQSLSRNSNSFAEAASVTYSGFVQVLLPVMVQFASETYTSFDASLRASMVTLSSEHTMDAVLLQLLAVTGVSGDALRLALENIDRNDVLALLVRFLQSPIDSSFPVDEVTVRSIALCSVYAVLQSSADVGTACLPTFFHLLRIINSPAAVLRSLAMKCFVSFASLLDRCTTRTLTLRSDVNVKVNEISTLVHGLVEQQEMVVNDSDAVQNIIFSIFVENSKSTETVSEVTLLAAASISTMQDDYGSFLVKLLPTSCLASNWKIVLNHLKNAIAKPAKNNLFLSAFLSWVAKDLKNVSTDKQDFFVQWLCDTVQSAKSLDAMLPHIVLTVVIPMLPLKSLPKSSFEALLRCLFNVQSTTNGSKDVVNAIIAMEADPSLGMMLLNDALNTSSEIDALLRVRKNSIVDEDVTDNSRMQIDDSDDEAKDESIIGYESKNVSISAKLRSMVAVAEMVVPMVLNQSEQLQQYASPLFRALFNLLDKLCQPGCVSVINLEFYKTITCELLMQLLNKAKSENILSLLLPVASTQGLETSKTPSKQSKNKKKPEASTSDSSSTTVYTADILRKDLSNILHSLSSVRSSNIHTSALNIIRHFIACRSDALSILVDLLGEFLSQTAVHGTHLLTRGKLLANLLSIIVPASASSSSAENKSIAAASRDVVFHILKPLPSMPANHRTVLLKALAKVEGQKEWMTLLITQSLLQHTLVKYETKAKEEKSITVDTISLSRAAQRRAQRVLMNSDSEEFFHIAEQFLLEQSALSIIKSVIKILDSSRSLSFFCIGGDANGAAADEDDVQRLLSHFAQLRNSGQEQQEDVATKRGHAATMAVLQLEFVNEILLSSQFHRQLASELLANRVTHKDMMEVAECSLQICVECDSLRQSRQRSTQRQIILRLESESHHLSAKLLSEIFADLSLGVLGNLQALLDGPSFLTMIQELLDHEVAAIRQRAIIFLKDRLQSLLSEKRMSQIEHGLYLDLCTRLRGIIKGNLSKLFDEKKDATVAPSSGTLSLPYAQSALLAIDVLVLKLGKTPQWQTVVMEILGEYLSYFDSMYQLVGLRNQQTGHYQQKALESRKFLGSLLLSCSSLCMALNAAALPSFPTLMEKTMRVFASEAAQWRDESVREMILDSDRRAHVLFLRSLISASAIIFSSLPKFSHPYIATILPLLLEVSTSFAASREALDLSGIDEDSEACLVVIGNELPPRLALPAVCACLSECMALGGDAMHRYVLLLQMLVSKADRATSLANMNILLPTVLSLLNALKENIPNLTRFSFEDVQLVLGDLVVEICLKLTENELKSFVLRLIDWKTGDKSGAKEKNSTEDEDSFYRLVHFYALANSLLNRFQSLFFSSVALFWAEMMGDLENSAKLLKKTVEKAKNGDSKDDAFGKKRKRSADIYGLFSDETKLVISLVTDSVSHTMSITRSLCTISGASFIDEKRYETIYPKVLAFLPLWQSFSGDDSYFQFARDQLSTTLCELCAHINRDLMWKPLNHQVLLLSRSASPLVRIVAVDTLRELFEKVGADYLAVLPECLSYISELLEDDNSEVVKHTRQAISVIEELSGESLDSYLQ